MANQSPKDVEGFFHVNINCTNFAQSLSFYQLVGFEKVLDFDDTPGPVRSFGQAGWDRSSVFPTIATVVPLFLRSRAKAARLVSTSLSGSGRSYRPSAARASPSRASRAFASRRAI